MKQWSDVALPESLTPYANSEPDYEALVNNPSWRVPPRRVIVQGFFPCESCTLKDYDCEAFRTANSFEMMLNSPYKSTDVVQGCGMVQIKTHGESK